MKLPNLRISNENLRMDEISIPLKALEKHFPERYEYITKHTEGKAIKSLYYEMGGTKNHLVFKDGTQSTLPIDDEGLNEILGDKYSIEFEHKEEVKALRLAEEIKHNNPKVGFHTIFTAAISARPAIIREYRNERGGIDEPTPEEYNKWLHEIKIKLLRNSDWSQLPDVGLTEDEIQVWKEYREKLRVLDKDPDPVNNITLPQIPE